MRLFLTFGLVVLGLSGCSSSAPATFTDVSWDGNYTIGPGAVQWNGSGEAIFRAELECNTEVYAWFSTDEGINGTLEMTIFDGAGQVIHSATFGNDNHEENLIGQAGTWKFTVHSAPDFDGNGIAFLECGAGPDA